MSEEQTAHALGIAASCSAGLVENLPSATRNVGAGNAAPNGMLAAFFARAGCDAAPRAIEGALGWARAMGNAPDMAALTFGLGDSWQIAQNTCKPYPSGIVFHAVIDACLSLRARLPNGAAYVAEALVEGSTLLRAAVPR